MPTKTFKRVSDQKPAPFRPTETELFPIEICRQMARVLGINDADKITRLHQLLNDPGSFAHIAFYVKKEGIPVANQRTALTNLRKVLMRTIKFIDELDWQSNEDVAAGYAKGKPIFTANADRISSPFYSQRDRDVLGMRRYVEAVAFAEAHLYTSSKSRLGIEIRQAKYIIEVYEEFTGQLMIGERSEKEGRIQVGEFLKLGVHHVTEGKLSTAQVWYVIRQAAEMVRQQRKNLHGVNYPSSAG